MSTETTEAPPLTLSTETIQAVIAAAGWHKLDRKESITDPSGQQHEQSLCVCNAAYTEAHIIEVSLIAAAPFMLAGTVPAPFTERDLEEMTLERDCAENWADKLAYAIAPVEVIGEHSSENNPWENALDEVSPRPIVVRTKLLKDLAAESPRLPGPLRDVVFEAVTDVIDKFKFPVQNMGDHPDAVEAGDVCVEVEKRIVSIIRAGAIEAQGLIP